MNELILPVIPGTLPAGTCTSGDSLQSLLNLLTKYMTVPFPNTFSGLTASGTPPSDTTQTWLQLDSLGRPVRIYTFAQGTWLCQHPIPPGMIMIWPFATPDFTVFDGGDANAPSAVSGPMWQTPMDNSGNAILTAQFPLGIGTLPSGTVISAGAAGGEETHVLQVPELAPHHHAVTEFNPIGTSAGSNSPTYFPGINQVPITTTTTGGDPNSGTPPTKALGHNTMPPYYGVLFIQRSNRLFYSAS